MRYTQKVSMWPVGLCTRTGLSTPIVKNGQLIGFYDGWIAGRKFPVDMAGFAVSVKFLLEVSQRFNTYVYVCSYFNWIPKKKSIKKHKKNT